MRLGAIARKIGSGATPTGGEAAYQRTRSKFALVRSQNVFDRRFESSGLAFISDEQAEKLKGAALAPGDLLLNITGDGVTFARSCAVPDEVLPACVNQHVCIVRVNESIADPGYVLSFLTHPAVKAYMESFNAGGSRRAITKASIESFELALPPLNQQHAIAQVLGTLDEKIQLNRRMNETLEAIARAIFKSWFVDFDPVRAKAAGEPPESICRRIGLAPDLLALFPDRLVDSEFGAIPEGWTPGTFGDIADHRRRGVQPNEISANTPYIALEHMPRRCIALSDWSQAEGIESNKFAFNKGEILFGKLRPYFHKVGVAPLAGVCSTDIVVIVPKADAWFGLVLGLASSDEFVEHTNAGSTGTKMPRTNWADMARYAIVKPPARTAEAFTNLIRPLVDRITTSIHEARSLASMRDNLLPELLAGKLSVPVKDIA